MENITLTPASENIELKARVLRVQNEFVKMGYKSVSAFINIVSEYCPAFAESPGGYKALKGFWYGRNINRSLVVMIETITEAVKHE